MASEYFRSLEFQISALTKVEPPFQQPVIPGGIIVPAVMIISFWPALQCYNDLPVGPEISRHQQSRFPGLQRFKMSLRTGHETGICLQSNKVSLRYDRSGQKKVFPGD